jgi:hypothetical protein
MLRKAHMQHPRAHIRNAGALVASAAALGGLAILPDSGLAANTISVGVGGSSIVVNGTTISTSNLTLAQLAKLQGVPAATVQLELDGVAANTPVAAAVESLVAGLPAEATLATALDELSAATGGTVSPQTALRQVIADEGTPGASGSNGVAGGSGAGGAGGTGAAAAGGGTTAAGAGTGAAATTPAKKRLSLRAGSRSLKGRPGSRVRVRFNVSSAAKLSYSGRKLAKGSRKVKSGANVLMVKLPRKHGNYQLVLKAAGADGQSAQTTVALHDAAAKPSSKGRR